MSKRYATRGGDAMPFCSTCRFWSEMLATINFGRLQAMCLSPHSKYTHKYTTGGLGCPAWRCGAQGAVDDPDIDPSIYKEDRLHE